MNHRYNCKNHLPGVLTVFAFALIIMNSNWENSSIRWFYL